MSIKRKKGFNETFNNDKIDNDKSTAITAHVHWSNSEGN